MTDQRMNVPSWDETFMKISEVVSRRSKDPSTQVGACIVSADNRILSVGYNGSTRGFEDDEFPWGKGSDDPLMTKYPFVVHAERNAILNFRGSFREIDGSKLYVTYFPCHECAKEVVQVGIREIIYRHDYDRNGLAQASHIIFDHAGVTLRHLV